jgi:hypothetical protein
VADVRFTHEDVQAEAGKKPWDRRAEFVSGIDPDDLADTAAAYARAAGEVGDTAALARRATEIAAGAGAADGAPLVDAEARVDETARDLQQDGDGVDAVVRGLVRALRLAIDTEREVDQVVAGPDGLDARFRRHLDAAVAEWDGWRGALQAAVGAARETPMLAYDVHSGMPLPLVVEYGGQRRTIAPRLFGGGQTYDLPDDLARDIRKRHLQAAAGDASAAFDDIRDAIDAYTRRLTELGAELRGHGFEVTDAALPDGLWLSGAVARAAAEGLAGALAQEPPDSALAARYAAHVALVTGSGDLTGAERAFLQGLYAHLDVATLAALGALDTTVDYGDTEPRGAAARRLEELGATQRALADGVMLLTDPERGGFDPAAGADRAALPAALRHFVYDHQAGGLFRTDYPGARFLPEDVRQLNGFAGLLAHATVPPGDAFAADLGRAAVAIHAATGQELYGMHWDVVNTGSGTLLEVAARNTDAAARLLSEEPFRAGLLYQQWEDSTGPAELITAGTTVPGGVDPDSAAARPYVEAAFHLLADAGDDTLRQRILGDDRELQAQLGHVDHTALQRAIGDTALRHLNLIAQFPGDGQSRFLEPANPGDPDARVLRSFLGDDLRYAFELSRADREGLFELMAGTEAEVRQDFRTGVAHWQAATAYEAFSRGTGEGTALQAIGRVAGHLENADVRTLENGTDPNNLRSTVVGAITSAAGWISGFGGWPGQAGAALSMTAFGLGETLRHDMELPLTPQQHAELKAMESGDWAARTLVAQAALATDYGGARGALDRLYGEPGSRLPDPAAPDFVRTNLMTGVNELETKAYAGMMPLFLDGYADGLGRPAR